MDSETNVQENEEASEPTKTETGDTTEETDLKMEVDDTVNVKKEPASDGTECAADKPDIKVKTEIVEPVKCEQKDTEDLKVKDPMQEYVEKLKELSEKDFENLRGEKQISGV